MNFEGDLKAARAAMSRGEFAAAARGYEALASAAPDNAAVWRALGQARHQARDAAGAQDAFDAALRLAPGDAGALLGRGHALRALGRTDAAVESYRAALATQPGMGEAWWSLAALKTRPLGASDLGALEALARAASASVHVLYAWGKALADAGRYDEAFTAWERGGRLRRAQDPYDPAAERAFARRTLAAFQAADHAALSVREYPSPRPIFVVGLPRAGSTLIARILGAHSQVADADEPPFLGQAARALSQKGFPATLARVTQADLSSLAGAYRHALASLSGGRPVVVDKNPNNHWLIGLICLAFPDAAIIYARRDPRDQCISAFGHLFARGFPFTSTLDDLGAHWRLVDTFIARMAVLFPGRVHTLEYEHLVTEPEAQTRRLLSIADLTWEAGCLTFHDTAWPVHTASAEQVALPVYTTSVNIWRRYAAHLMPLSLALQRDPGV